jgi:hypothetical protein
MGTTSILDLPLSTHTSNIRSAILRKPKLNHIKNLQNEL